MPSGKEHLQIWKRGTYLSLGIACASVIIFESVAPLAFIPGYGIGFFIDPDLDQDQITKSERRMLKYFGDVGAFIVGYFVWYGYRFTHRNDKGMHTSHTPFLGTLSRWAYVFLLPMIFWVWYRDWSQFELFVQPWFIWLFFGNVFSDLLHIAADYGYLPRVLRGNENDYR